MVKELEQNRARFLRLTCGTFNKARERTDDGTILSQVKLWIGENTVRLPLAIEYFKEFSSYLRKLPGTLSEGT